MLGKAAVVAALMVAGCTNYYDPPEGWEGSFTAAEVLNRALEKAGSRVDPMEDAEDLMVTAQVRLLHDVEPVDVTYVVRWKRPAKFAIEVTKGPLSGRKIVCDGEQVAEIDGGKVVRRDVKKEDTAFAQFMNRLFVLQYFRGSEGSGAELQENTRGPKGEPWIRLLKRDAQEKPYCLMLDAATLEPRLFRALLPFEGGIERTIDTWLLDYRADSRAGRLPFTWKSYDGDKLREEVRIARIAWNQGLPDSEFAIP